jgi:hypothetical protein
MRKQPATNHPTEIIDYNRNQDLTGGVHSG